MFKLSHVNIGMPSGSESEARRFYGGLLCLREIQKPKALRSRGGCWFNAGGLDVHISADAGHEFRTESRHFGLEVEDVDALKAKLESAGVKIDSGRPAPWKRFFVLDPFGNRIEFHEIGGLRAG